MEITPKSLNDTKKNAGDLAKKWIKEKGPVVVALYGDLGSGKTTFVQFFAKVIGVKEKVLSPTFVVIKTFKISDANTRIHANDANRFKFLVHIDAYRLKSAKDLLDLGFKDIIKDKGNIVLIEWPEKIERYLPKNAIKIYFKTMSEKERKIVIKIPNHKSQISNKLQVQNLKIQKV